MAIDLVPLCTLRLQLKPPIQVNAGPAGTRLQTADGAIIFVQYNGRMDTSQGLRFPMTAYVAPVFETGDERYEWLNRVQAVGKGILHEDLSLNYEWYEVR